MKIVADSGSTKTDWRIIGDNGLFLQAESVGLNPNFATEEHYQEAIVALLAQVNPELVKEFWFYGAGCASDRNKQLVKGHFETVFVNAEIHVESDMLGAAKALCGKNPGMAAILGTGMNTCVYNGEQITHNHTSLGYILGDEGSGAYFGKLLIAAYLRNQLPEELKANFDKRFNLTPADIIENVYRKPLPNKFLAQFAKYIYQNLKHEFYTKLVVDGFTAFFQNQVKTYPNWQDYQLHLTGSVAYYFGNLLKRVAAEEGVRIGSVVEKPIAALGIYHEEN